MNVYEVLVSARDLLVDAGWCADMLRDHLGRHCAVGAVCEVLSPATMTEWPFLDWHFLWYENELLPSVLAALRKNMPAQDGGVKDWCAVAMYNNSRNSFMDVLAMFDAAIAETAHELVGAH